MINHSFFIWVTAIIIGSLINACLFLFLPAIGRTAPPKKPQIIELEFMTWQQPVQKKNKIPDKVKQKTKEQPKPKPKPKKKKIKPAPKPAPKPKPKPRPVLSEVVIPEKIKSKPIKPVLEKPELTIPKPVLTKEKIESQDVELELPTPMPIFKLTSLPRMIHRQTPTYPPSMKQQGKEATVKLEVLLDIKGRVRKVTIKKSGGEAFDQAAIAAINNSTFMPANINGKPVAVLMKIPVKFRLR